MKNKIINAVVLLYGLVVFITVFGILFLAFKHEFPSVFDKFGFLPLRVFDGVKKIFMVTVLQARHEFPHFGVPFVVGYHCCFIMLAYILLFKKHLQSKSSSFLSHYLLKPFDKRHTQYTFITLTIGWIFCLFVIEAGLRHIGGAHANNTGKSGGIYVSPYQTARKKGWFWNYPPLVTHEMVVPEFSQIVKTNSLGFVDHEWSFKKKSRFRLACIGDSFTQGVGALSSDSSYPSLLRTMFSNCEVMNWGIGGSDPVFGEMLLEQKVVHYHPDIVTLTINESDLNDIAIRGGKERFHADSTMHFRDAPSWEWLYGASFIARLVAIDALGFDVTLHVSQSQAEKEHLQVMQVLNECIDTFHQVCLKNNIRPIFIFHPIGREMKSGHMEFEKTMRYTKSKGYEYINMLEYFQQHGVTPKNSTNYFWSFDAHNNANGYKLFAKGIYEYLTPLPISSKKETDADSIR